MRTLRKPVTIMATCKTCLKDFSYGKTWKARAYCYSCMGNTTQARKKLEYQSRKILQRTIK